MLKSKRTVQIHRSHALTPTSIIITTPLHVYIYIYTAILSVCAAGGVKCDWEGGRFLLAGVVIVSNIRMVYSYNPYLDPKNM